MENEKNTAKQNNDSLLSRIAAQKTEIKTPGETNLGVKSTFWDEKEASDKTKKKTEENNSNSETQENTEGNENNNSTQSETKVETEKKPGLTLAAKEASAKTLVGLIDLGQKVILTPIIYWKFKKKFTKEEVTKLDAKNLADADLKDLDGEDLALAKKWNRLLKGRDKSLEEIPLTPTEKADLQESAFTYMDIKGKELPPEMLMYANLGIILGKRVVTVLVS